MACAFCYYGVVFMSTELFEQLDAKANNISIIEEYNNKTSGACDPDRASCTMLSTSDYVGLLWITLAEFPGKFGS